MASVALLAFAIYSSVTLAITTYIYTKYSYFLVFIHITSIPQQPLFPIFRNLTYLKFLFKVLLSNA